MVEKFCECTHWMKVGYVWKKKNEIFQCPVCGRVYFSPAVKGLKKILIKKFARHVHFYSENEVRLYFTPVGPEIIADSTGQTIKNLEEGYKELQKQFPGIK